MCIQLLDCDLLSVMPLRQIQQNVVNKWVNNHSSGALFIQSLIIQTFDHLKVQMDTVRYTCRKHHVTINSLQYCTNIMFAIHKSSCTCKHAPTCSLHKRLENCFKLITESGTLAIHCTCSLKYILLWVGKWQVALAVPLTSTQFFWGPPLS